MHPILPSCITVGAFGTMLVISSISIMTNFTSVVHILAAMYSAFLLESVTDSYPLDDQLTRYPPMVTTFADTLFLASLHAAKLLTTKAAGSIESGR